MSSRNSQSIVSWPDTICPELRQKRQTPPQVDFGHYWRLHQEGRRHIQGWLERGWNSRDCRGEHCFESLIFTWIAFNSWGSCIADTEIDRQWLDALMASSKMCNLFDELLANGESPFHEYVSQFHAVWPIFKVQELRDAGIHYWSRDIRERPLLVREYLERGMTKFEPACWKRHMDEGGSIPMDWPHTLTALYRVRCNLFHGEKAPYSEIDRTIVRAALRVLVYFLHETPFFRLDQDAPQRMTQGRLRLDNRST